MLQHCTDSTLHVHELVSDQLLLWCMYSQLLACALVMHSTNNYDSDKVAASDALQSEGSGELVISYAGT